MLRPSPILGCVLSFPRPEIFFFFPFLPLSPTPLTNFQGMTALALRKLHPTVPTRERVQDLSPSAASLSQRTPETPRATHCFGVELVPRLRQHFIHPRLVHESDEAETPAPRSEGEADGYKDSEWPRREGRARWQERSPGLTWIFWSGGPASPDTLSPPRTGRSIRAALL